MPEFEVINSEIRLRVQCEAFLAAPMALLKLESTAAAMADADMRLYFGKTLQLELMPHMDLRRRDEAVVMAVKLLENAAICARTDVLLPLLLDNFSLHIVPLLGCKTRGLCLALAALVMLLGGAKRGENGYTIPGATGDSVALRGDEEKYYFFSRLSNDMTAETLAYAVMKDETLFGAPLPKDDAFEDLLVESLRDLQILGVRGAMKKAGGEMGT